MLEQLERFPFAGSRTNGRSDRFSSNKTVDNVFGVCVASRRINNDSKMKHTPEAGRLVAK